MFAVIKISCIFVSDKQLSISIKNKKMTTSNEIKGSVYEIKINRKWSKVRATSMMALSKWAKKNNVADWRMVGMMSRSETKESQLLKVVA